MSRISSCIGAWHHRGSLPPTLLSKTNDKREPAASLRDQPRSSSHCTRFNCSHKLPGAPYFPRTADMLSPSENQNCQIMKSLLQKLRKTCLHPNRSLACNADGLLRWYKTNDRSWAFKLTRSKTSTTKEIPLGAVAPPVYRLVLEQVVMYEANGLEAVSTTKRSGR